MMCGTGLLSQRVRTVDMKMKTRKRGQRVRWQEKRKWQSS